MATGSQRQAWKKGCGDELSQLCRVVLAYALLLAVPWLLPGCPAAPGDPELKKEVQALKAEVTAVKEKLGQVEAGQKALMDLVKDLQKPQAAVPGAPATPAAALPGAAVPLTVPELFKNKDQLLGTRVTVRGVPGPVMMHKKTLFLGGPEGMVEVIYGNLQDTKQVERLTAQTIDTPITVSGILSAAAGQTKVPTRLIIMADTVEF